ncbi:MAG: SMP-30/gluconolactonase/LRE family protein [Planctomycetota bacterium]|nr:SMP-30/gluconolactonase/LRE family protein [Planctomycetota bacterium]
MSQPAGPSATGAPGGTVAPGGRPTAVDPSIDPSARARSGRGCCAFLVAASVTLASGGCRAEAGPQPGANVLLVIGSGGSSPGRFRMPRAVAVDRESGRSYVVDRSGRIQVFSRDGDLVCWWSLPEHEYGQPVGLTLEAPGTLLVSDSHYQRLLRYSPLGEKLLFSWGRQGTGPGELTFGRDAVVDSEGNVYVGDYGSLNDRILKFASDGRFLKEWGGRGAAHGQFDRPQGMAIERRDGREYLLVADSNNHRVQRFDLEGRFVAAWGRLGNGSGELRYPFSVAVGSRGHIYVAEWGNNRVQRFDPDGRPLGTWGRAGRRLGELLTPWDVEVGPDERIYVVDKGNHRVQVFRWPDA